MNREDELKMQARVRDDQAKAIEEVWQKTSDLNLGDPRTVTVANAWRKAHALYMIGTVRWGTGGVMNLPVSVYNEHDEVVWGPGPLWEAEAYVDLCAAKSVLDALDDK